ncbi:MAG TPA: NAD(P)-binding domain-containing protein [Dongiaceae bacterium]|nr:NAD(P)-binding domain-containing protein [Dongiaceae bacterium]
MTTREDFPKGGPVAIIGAGPIGLAAAAHLAERGLPFHVYEAGVTVGANIRDWGHVRVFTTWEQNVDAAAQRMLQAGGWVLPDPVALPTGDDLYRHYLKPLAALPSLAPHIETGTKVTRISREGLDKMTSGGRAGRSFELHVSDAAGKTRVDYARAVIDASGTWQNPNPLGAAGLPATGEDENADRIAYGMPDVLGAARDDYAGARVAVVGAGYSAINTLLDLASLAASAPGTSVTWLVRGRNLARIYGGGTADQLPARGSLGGRLRQLVEAGKIALVTGFATTALEKTADGLVLHGLADGGKAASPAVERIIVATGQRPDLAMTRELRLDLDPWIESVRALGPLIDPNLHSCGSVPPHGHRETGHPEPGFYTIGVKSYGRAPTFLLLTGYEQARSVAAAIAGDLIAADKVELVLPETGICSDTGDDGDGQACCGGPAITETRVTEPACCGADATAKSAGKAGCGCGEAA